MNDKIDSLKNICKAHNVKLTCQRLEIFQEVVKSKEHPSAEEIYKRVKIKMPTISIDTVYRTLNTFAAWGLISKVYLFNERTIFDPELKTHHHMICIKCKKIKDFIWPEFDNMNLPEDVKLWGHPDRRYGEIRGICNDCADVNRGE